MKKSYIYLVGCTFLFVLGLSFVTGSIAQAQTPVAPVALSGWAWSSTIGWLSFNSSNSGAGSPPGSSYGVNMSGFNNGIAVLGGQAWSPNIGWVSFDDADVKNCPVGTCTPTVNLNTGVVSGWAKALAGDGTMGWDGWIGLSSTTWGVSFARVPNTFNATFSGSAWGSTNVGWLSFDSVTCPTCFVPLNVTSATVGIGAGTITSSVGGINCGSVCSAAYILNTPVTLTEVPGTGSTFTGWTGACGGTATTCTLTMSEAKNVTATFSLVPVTVSVETTGPGTVTSNTGGIVCSDGNTGTCSSSYVPGTNVTFTEIPAAGGNTFKGWGGACSGTATTCTITVKGLSGDYTATTYGQWKSISFSASEIASGVADEMSDPDNDSVPNIYEYAIGTDPHVLNPSVANKMAVFRGYVSGTNFVFDHKLNVNRTDITFKTAVRTDLTSPWSYFPATPSLFTETEQSIDSATKLITDKSNTSFTSVSAMYFAFGINKGGVDYWAPAAITPGPSFGSNPGTPTSVLPLVTALFAGNPTLTLNKNGSGSVTDSSVAPGSPLLSCGTAITTTPCSSSQYPLNTVVTLTAVPTAGYSFTGWSGGGCDANGLTTCTVTMDISKTITATFTTIPVGLNVTVTGVGGIVTGGAISCTSVGGASCSTSVPSGTAVMLTAATTTSGITFIGWGGDCISNTTSSTCTLTLNAMKNVTAAFDVVASNLTGTCSISSTAPYAPITISPTLSQAPSGASWLQTSFYFTTPGTYSPTVILYRSATDQVDVPCGQITIAAPGPIGGGAGTLTGTCSFSQLSYPWSTSLTVTPILSNTSGGSGSGTGYYFTPSSLNGFTAGSTNQPTVTLHDDAGNSVPIACDTFTVGLPTSVTLVAGTYKLSVAGTASQASQGTRTSVISNNNGPVYAYWLSSSAGCTIDVTRASAKPVTPYLSQWASNGLPTLSVFAKDQTNLKKILMIGIPDNDWYLQMKCGGALKGPKVKITESGSTATEI